MMECCYECGHTWGVTMEPRERVLCASCATPRPWRRPVHYWQARICCYFSSREHTWPRSPEWWDQQADLADLRVAVESAKATFGGGS